MQNNALVGRCGIYCGACPIYRAYKDGGTYREHVSKYLELPLAKIRCEGCQAVTPECNAYSCTIQLCLNERGYQYCFECPEYRSYSCEKFQAVAKKWEADGLNLSESLELIRNGKIDEWKRKYSERFACSSCGNPLPAFRFNFLKICYHCGAVITKQP